MNDQKILNTFDRVLAELDRYSKVFRNGGMLEKAVAEVGGDIAWFDDIRDGLEDTIHAIEEAQMSAGIAIQGDFEESAQLGESKQINESTGLLDANDEDGFMARSQLYFMARDAIKLHGMIGDRDELEPWVQSKITKAAEAIEVVRRNIEYKQVAAVEVPAEPEQGASADAEQEFHAELDNLVHDTFGKRPEEIAEGYGKGMGPKLAASLAKATGFEWDFTDSTESKRESIYVLMHRESDTTVDVTVGYREDGSKRKPLWQIDVENAVGDMETLATYRVEVTPDVIDSLFDNVAHDIAMEVEDSMVSEAKTKTRLDKECWDGYKIGNPKTKMKGDTRVNNCVPESIEEGADLDDGSKALNPQTIAKNMMRAAKAQAAKKVKK